MVDADIDLPPGWRKFEGIGKNVHNHLVKITTVYPDGQFIVIMFVGEGQEFCLGLVVEKVIDIFHELDQVCFCHAHLHLAFVNLSQVHHLVDEVENAVCVSFDDLIDAFALWILLVLNQ